jgi:hypothetical protein
MVKQNRATENIPKWFRAHIIEQNGVEKRNNHRGKRVDGSKVTIHKVSIDNYGSTASFYGRVWKVMIKGHKIKMTITLFDRKDGIVPNVGYKDKFISIFTEGNRRMIQFSGLSTDFFASSIRVRTGTGCGSRNIDCTDDSKCNLHHLWLKISGEEDSE